MSKSNFFGSIAPIHHMFVAKVIFSQGVCLTQWTQIRFDAGIVPDTIVDQPKNQPIFVSTYAIIFSQYHLRKMPAHSAHP